MTTRPPIIIPPALAPLAKRKRFVGWKWENGKNGKLTKVPYRGHTPNRKASSKDPETWCLLDDAMRAYSEGKVDGIGFVLTGSGVTAIDVDDCRAKTTGIIAPWASDLIKRSGSYAEITPSEEGVRIIGLGRGKHLHRKFSVPDTNGVSCELYRRATRVITITGQQLGTATKLTKLDALLDRLYAELNGAKQKKPKSKGGARKLDDLIKNGEGGHFGGDRSRAVWFVINRLLELGKSADEIVAVLIDPANGIAAHCLDQGDPERHARRQIEKAQQQQNGDDAEIERLAKLSAAEYEHQRKDAADKLGYRTSILDRLVAAERTKLGLDADDGKQGHAITFPEPEPWPQPVDGAALLADLASNIRNHVVMSDHERDICALWVVHTYLIKRFKISPKLWIRSPVMRCGKTTLLEVLAELVFRAWTTGSITKAALFRVIEMYHPTLLIDEIDTFVGEDEDRELRGMLNHSHRYDGTVTRTVGEDHEPRKFSVYAAVALSGIGGLAATLADRSVVAELKRRRPGETIAPLRIGRMQHLHELRRRIVRWIADHEEHIAERDPKMPSIIDREADNWQVLLAIADEAGGEWPERARKVAVASHDPEEADSAGRLEMLLADIRKIFADQGTEMPDLYGAAQVIISSAKLVKALVGLEGRPWAEMGKNRKPLTQHGLARMLKPLKITPEKVGPRDQRVNGYIRAKFDDAFERYVPFSRFPPPQVDTRTQADEMGTSEISRVDTEAHGVHSGNARNPCNDGPVSGCPLGKGENGKKGVSSASDEFPYTGPIVTVPDQGSDPLDEHGAPQTAPICDYCGRPGGDEVAYGEEGGTARLHRECQDPWIRRRMGEEGIA